MRHRLAGHFAVIDPNIEALNRAVLVLDIGFHLVQQRKDCVSFSAVEFKEIFNVAPWNDERVKRCHGVSVMYRISESIGTHHSSRYDLAEMAPFRSGVVAFSDFSKVSVIPSGPVCSAPRAEGLEVLKLVGPTVFAGQDVRNL